MNKLVYILTIFLFTMRVAADTTSVYSEHANLFRKNRTTSQLEADSIMQLVIANAKRYEKSLSSYESEIYVKGRAEILRQNKLIRFAHHVFPVNRKTKDIVFEMISHSKYEAPNIYYHDFKALNGNAIPNYRKQQEFMNFLNLNVYAPTAYNEGYLMPLAKNAFRFYKFDLREVIEEDGLKIYKIRFLPNQWSMKLMSGDLYIIDKYWTVDKIDISGRYSFADFNLVMSFSRDYRWFVLPETASLFIRYHILGNAVVSNYDAAFKYQSVEWIEENNTPRRKRSLDLSNYFRLSSDTIPIIRDTTFWNKKRKIPLLPEEEILYEKSQLFKEVDPDSTLNLRFLKATEKITNSIRFNNKTMRLRYSGFLNPFRMGYSKKNGFTYKQKVRFTKRFENDKEFRVNPSLGFVSRRKEVFFDVPIYWDYLPKKMGSFSLTGGNENTGYSSEIMDELNEMLKDSTFTFEDLNMQYFRHYYLTFRHNIEIFNGFQVSADLSYHKRTAIKKPNLIDDDLEEDITDIINDRYNDFTPLVRFTYTPRQYYRMDGKRKEYVYSRFPTASVEFARGVPGVLNSTGNYTRIEGEINQSIPIGMLRIFNYHLSAGAYTLKKSTYFSDFEYFRRRNFPDTWEDQIGGVFNLLDSEWFNASDRYFQAHFMYESPFVLFQLFNTKLASRLVLSERFYFSTLTTPALPSYSEIGYGIGNQLFNVGVFAGFKRYEYQSIGFKFTFEIFN
ncbi:MAG: DUF5686 family protein [Tannerellaceae bacterium]|nr:DUF5686 family protein [Tannerellaceae bacterium]